MRKILGVILFLILVSSASAETGGPAADFMLLDTAGKSHALHDYKGKLVVLEWYNPGCPFVKKHYASGNMPKLQKDYAAKDVVWLTVVSSAKGKQGNLDPQEHEKTLRDWGSGQTALLIDESGTVGRLYHARTTPHLFIVNKEGLLAYEGAIDDRASTEPGDIPGAKNYVAKALNELLEGKPVSEPETEPYGCSVKFAS